MLAAQPDCPVPFPHAGSRAFLRDSADPVTIIRRNADFTVLVRLDPRPFEGRNRDATGNRTVPLADLFADEDAAGQAGLPAPKRRRTRRRTGRSATSGPQGRPAARSDAAKGRESEDIAHADACADHGE